MNKFKIIKLDEISSTNTYLKEKASELCDRTAVVAEIQTKGRGRLSRTFHSNCRGGLYLSILLKNYEAPFEITIRTAVAVQRAILLSFGTECEIKWVNDLYVKGKKVCGILCERTGDGSIVCGIGVNVSNCDFPLEIQNIAACLCTFNPEASKEALLSVLLECFEAVLHEDFSSVLSHYREKCFIIGKPLLVILGDCRYDAVADSIEDDGSLVVIKEDGTRVSLNSGEITLKLR